ncbi:NADH:flavin oxidoreductase/NADH oxidase [Epithele typhae]|uniref:NADH:flavin oxidoreductase/NADH oxidase n=1 Tax=Epithele typhae TaxID=378194 RepID=UPI0020084277|nr:NADH:flavin oxidoreductase/NADH oxidase [Epithele typhae]KAH9942513.1 NADH:flavin oxidoreductase/NADH oxidase [Epithele typhae]
MSSEPALFQPMQIGKIGKVSHRVVMAPLTRYRNTAEHVPMDIVLEYYTQRASVPGTLLITEAIMISPQASGLPHGPGLWNEEQIAGWKKIVDAVHAKGCFLVCQLWALGRAARPALFHKEFPDYPYVSASDIPLEARPNDVPKPLTKEEIKEYLGWFHQAAKTAVDVCGFDGVEVHGASGYLPDQFLQTRSNARTDEYGGAAANRARFALEVVDALVAAVGAARVAYRFSPWSTYQDMRMADDGDVVATFAHVVDALKARHPGLAYLHYVTGTSFLNAPPKDPEDLDVIWRHWAPRPTIATGGHTRESGLAVAETGQLVGYGSLFIANPDLPFRLKHDVPLNAPDPSTFYACMEPKGYIDYPFSDAFLNAQKV